MDPNIWGPSGWFFLHAVTFYYPNKPTNIQKEDAIHFFESLRNLLPCEVCKNNYEKHLEEHPIRENVGNRNELIQWLVDVHNAVNIETGKPILDINMFISVPRPFYASNIQIAMYIAVVLVMIVVVVQLKEIF